MSFFGVELNAQLNRLLHAIKLTLAKNKYLPNFRTIYQSFAKYDPEQSGFVTTVQLEKALNENGIFFKKFEMQVFEKAFLVEGKVNWFNLMSLLREPINSYRSNVIENVFRSLDGKQEGKVHYTVLMERLNPSEINEFKLGYKSKELIGKELLQMVPLTQDGYLSQEEFYNFYSDLSLNISSDEIYGRFISSHWSVPFTPPLQTSTQELIAAIKLIRFKLIQKTQATHEEFILNKIFNQFDTQKQGHLTVDDLRAMLIKLQIPTEERLVGPLLERMDHQKVGRVQFEEFKNFLFFDPYHI